MGNRPKGVSERELKAMQAGRPMPYAKAPVKPTPSFTRTLAINQVKPKMSDFQALPKGVAGPVAPKKVLATNALDKFNEAKRNIQNAVKLQSTVAQIRSTGEKQIRARELEEEAKKKTAIADSPIRSIVERAKDAGRYVKENAGGLVSSSLEGVKARDVLNAPNPNLKQTAYGVAKTFSKGAQGMAQAGGFLASKVLEKVGFRGAASEARKVAIGENEFSKRVSAANEYTDLSERKAGLVADLLQFPLAVGKTGAVSKTTGRVVDKAIEKGASPLTINRIIEKGKQGLFAPIEEAARRPASVLRAKTAIASESGDIVNDVSPKFRDTPAPKKPRKETLPNEGVEVREDAVVKIREKDTNIREKVKRFDETTDEVEKAKISDEIFTDIEDTKRLYKEATGKDAPDDFDELLRNLDEIELEQRSNFSNRRIEKMSARDMAENRNMGRPLKAPVFSSGKRGFGSGKGRKAGVLGQARTEIAIEKESKKLLERAERNRLDITEQGQLMRFIEARGKLTPAERREFERILAKSQERGATRLSGAEAERHYLNLAKQYDIDQFREAFPRGTDEETIKDLFLRGKKLARETQPVKPDPYTGETELTTKLLEDLKGRSTVSKRYLEDATNRPELKQAERDLFRNLLKQEGDQINVKDFASKVKSELLPLEPSHLKDGRYENISLPYEERGPVEDYTERIYSSPIKTSAGDIHYSGDYPNTNYFAHSRIEDTPDNTRRVIEIQSDLFQKGRLESEKLRYKATPIEDTNLELQSGRFGRTNTQPLGTREKELSKLESYRNTWHERVIREELKKAAEDGKTKVQFPTGETAMKIEGLGESKSWYTGSYTGTARRDTVPLKPEMLKVGQEVNDSSTDWIITDVLGDGKFKAVPKDTHRFEIEVMNEESLYRRAQSLGLISYEQELDVQKAIKDPVIRKAWEDKYAETFDISGKVDQENPIYKFYEKTVQKYLNKFGGKLVTDKQGVSWVEVPVKKEMATQPVMAFANASGAAGGFINEEGEIDFTQYNVKNALLGLGAGTLGIQAGKMGLFQKSINRQKAKMAGEARVPRYTQDEIKSIQNEVKYSSIENKKEFTKQFNKWVAERDVAKTTGYQVGSKIEVPQGKEWEVVKAIESGNAKDGVAAQFKGEFDRLFNEAKEAGIDVRYLKDYITHVWKQDPLEVAKIAEHAAKRGFKFSQGRSIPTYEEGIELGLTPMYTSPRQILGHYAQKLEEAKANMKFLDTLKEKGLIVDSAVGRKAQGLVEINAPGMIKSQSYGGDGVKIIGSYYATPEVAEQINRVFGQVPTDTLHKGMGVLAKASSTLQDITLSGGIPKTPFNAFSFAQMTKEVLAGRLKSPFTAAIRSSFGKFSTDFQKKNIGAIKEMQARNVPVNTTLSIESLGEDTFLKKAFTGSDPSKWEKVKSMWSKSMNEPTFQRFMTELQINLYNDVKNKAMGKGFFNLRKGVSEEEAADIAAEAVKNFYGIISSGKMAARSSLAKDTTGTFLFAPRYREAMINFWINNVKAISPVHFGSKGVTLNNPLSLKNQQNTKFMIGALATYAAYDYLNQKFNNGKHLWENPSGKEDKLLIPGDDGYTKGIPYLSSIATIPRAVYRQGKMVSEGKVADAVKDAGQTYLSSMVKPLADVAANSDYYGREIVKESDSIKDKFKKQGVYLGTAYTGHPYIKAGVSAYMDKEPGYQTVSKALEAPIRYYKNESLAKSDKYGTLDKKVKEISNVPVGPEQTQAIQDYIASLPPEDRHGIAYILREKGFNTKGVSTSDAVIRFSPIVEEAAKIEDQGGDLDEYLRDKIRTKEDAKDYGLAKKSFNLKVKEEYLQDIPKVADLSQSGNDDAVRQFIESVPKSKREAVINAIVREIDKREEAGVEK